MAAGYPAIGSSAFEGSRVLLVRAWMIVTNFKDGFPQVKDYEYT
jgi:hypothetical protein